MTFPKTASSQVKPGEPGRRPLVPRVGGISPLGKQASTTDPHPDQAKTTYGRICPTWTGDVVTTEQSDLRSVQDAWIGGQRSDNTKAAYRRDTDEFFDWCGSHGYDPLGATRVELDRYRGWLTHHRRRGGPVSQSTLGRKLTSLSSFYTYAVVDLEILGRSPMSRVKRPDTEDGSRTDGMDLTEANRFLAAADAAGELEAALLRVMLSTGIRAFEACGANTSDLGMDRGHRVLTVVRKGRRRQKLPVVPLAWAALDAYLGGRAGALFRSKRARMYRQEVYRLVREVAASAGIHEKHITPHSLRHTAITLALDEGVPLRLVQEMAGHRDPRTTIRYDRSREAIDKSPVHVLGRVLSDTTGVPR